MPSTVIQGKVFIGIGPLENSEPSKKVFAQLYVMDPQEAELEAKLRMTNMQLPKSVTPAEAAELEK